MSSKMYGSTSVIVFVTVILIGSLALSQADADDCLPDNGYCADCSEAINERCCVRVCNSSGCGFIEVCIKKPEGEEACLKRRFAGKLAPGVMPLIYATCQRIEGKGKCKGRLGRPWRKNF